MLDEWGAPITIRDRQSEDPDDAQRYLVVVQDTGRPLYVFGMLIQGGDTREEAVFWAERFASKNGVRFIRPEGWEDVEGALPDKEPAAASGREGSSR